MAARGSGRQTGVREGAWAQGRAGRMVEGITARVDRFYPGDDPHAHDVRLGVRRIVAGIKAVSYQRPVILLGSAFALAMLAVYVFKRSRSSRQADATPAASVAPRGDGPTRGSADASAPDTDDTSPIATPLLDAPNALGVTSDVGARVTAASDATLVAPARDEAAPVRVTGRDGHVPPVVVSAEPLTSTPWPQTLTTSTSGPTL